MSCVHGKIQLETSLFLQNLFIVTGLTTLKRKNYSAISGSFVQRQKRIAIYHVKKLVKDSQLWKQTLSILPDSLENWHFISHFVWKSTKTLELLRIFDELFDVINGDPFLTLYKTSANVFVFITEILWRTFWRDNWRSVFDVVQNFCLEVITDLISWLMFRLCTFY